MSNAPVCRPRFKGIENFLRRIAFNLGNTPSQTEVKIISCIPIDVTDLQNKIIDLEKELDERACPGRAGPRETVACNTMLVGPSRGPSCGLSNRRMSCPRDSTADESSGNCSIHPGACNPVSSACVGLIGKVKKMSKKRSKCKPQMVYYAQTTSRSPFKQSSPGRSKSPYSDNLPYSRNSPHRQHHEETHFSKRRSHDRAGERVERTERSERAERAAERIADWTNERMNDRIVEWNREHTMMCAMERTEGLDEVTDAVRRMYQHERLPPESTLSSHFSVPVCRDEAPPPRETPTQSDGDLCSCCHGLVHNLDVGRLPAYVTANNKDHREHSAYYDSSLYDLVPVKERTTQKRNVENMSPIREEKGSPITYYKGKVLYGGQPQPPRAGHHKLHCKRKKLPMKTSLKKERVLKAMQKRKLDRLASVGTMTNSVECGRVYVKYRGKARAVHLPRPVGSPQRLRSRSPVHSRSLQHVQLQLQLPGRSPPPAPPPSPPVQVPTRHSQKNAEVLTMNCNEIECQTTASRVLQMEPPAHVEEETHKTEATLDQIKSILHAVLTEVKTNTAIKGVTKDAVVQKGRSQSNLPLQSYGSSYGTYNASTISPPLPSGMSANMAGAMSPTMPGGLTNTIPCGMGNVIPHLPVNMPAAISNTMPNMMTPTGMADKNYMQNYPLFIHTMARQCACCNRTLTEGARTNPLAANTATNTELMARTNVRNKETEKLIKEIYKSIATDHAQRNDSGSDGRSTEDVNRKKYKSKMDSEARARLLMESLIKSEKREATTVSYGGRARGVSRSSTPTHSASTVCRLQFDEDSAETSDRGQTMPTSLEPSPSRITHVSSVSRSHRVSRDQSQAPSQTSSAEQSREISRDSTPERFHESARPRSRGRSRAHLRMHSRVHSRHARSRERDVTPEESPARGARHKPQERSEEDSDTDVTVINAEKYESQKKKKSLLRNVIGKLFSTGRVKRPERPGKADAKSMTSEVIGNDIATDSDDYETIVSQSQYSANSDEVPEHKRRHYMRRGSGSGASQEEDHSLRKRHHKKPTRYISPYSHVARHKRSAYLEQHEYRRHFNESVPYHGGDAHADLSGRGGRSRRRPYFQQYETRAALMHKPSADDDHHRHDDQPRKPVTKPQTHAIPKRGFHLNITKSATQGLRWLKKRKTTARH